MVFKIISGTGTGKGLLLRQNIQEKRNIAMAQELEETGIGG